MTRHARNCTAGVVYTYHEKKKDAEASGYGTESKRLGKDSLRNFDCCCLSLQPCRNPVVTPDGFLYDKEAILEYVVAKKIEILKALKEFQKQKCKEEAEKEKLIAVATVDRFKKLVTGTPGRRTEESASDPDSVSNMANGKDKQLPSFWVPSQTPDAKKVKLKKPDKTVYCPMSGKPLKMNELVPVKFKEITDPDDKRNVLTKDNRYMCAVTSDVLSNSIPAAVIRTTGDVVTVECVEKLIKKDWTHPLTGEKLSEKDIIYLQRGATGFSQVNSNLEIKNPRPALQ